jgi:hypothetical protein
MGAVIGGLGPYPQGGIDWRIGLVLGAVWIPTAFLGSRPVSQPTLLLAFAGLTLITAAPMLLPGPATRRATEHAGQDALPDHDRGGSVGDEHHDALRGRALEAGADPRSVATITLVRVMTARGWRRLGAR